MRSVPEREWEPRLVRHFGRDGALVEIELDEAEGEHSPKVYSIALLTRHEIINDTIDGNPYMVGYCVLADLAAVYTRIYCDTTLTFGVSGYTYKWF